jgi:histidinol dehydrogenase
MKTLKKAKPKNARSQEDVQQRVADIVKKVKAEGNSALREYSVMFDQCNRESYRITEEEINKAIKEANQTTLDDLRFAAHNVEEFAKRQKDILCDIEEEIKPGVILGHRVIPVESVAGYVPGGRYPLPSSAIMSIVPAKVAGAKRLVACSPAIKGENRIHSATLAAMSIAGADEVYCMGGAQAIAVLAYGTETIEPVEMIVGPGNQYVTEAKRQVYGTVGIDFLAGPSEVVVIADSSGNPKRIAADLLAQSEHDPQARGILLCTDEYVAKGTERQVEEYLKVLPTAELARISWEDNGEIILFDSIEEAVEASNRIAPEHLELQCINAEEIIKMLHNYGSLFIGEEAAEVMGDYVVGTNHILPTMEVARYSGGVWVGTFLKVVTHQRLTKEGLKLMAPVASRLAEVEGLFAHKLAADVRIED